MATARAAAEDSSTPLLSSPRSRQDHAASRPDDDDDVDEAGGSCGDPTVVTLTALGVGLAVVFLSMAIVLTRGGEHNSFDESFDHFIAWLSSLNVVITVAIVVSVMTVRETGYF